MGKRLSAERLAQWKAGQVNGFTRWHELMLHIEAVEAELKHCLAAWHVSQNELAEAKAEIARLQIKLGPGDGF